MWSSKQQRVVALSSMEAEYIALSSASQQAIFLRGLLRDLDSDDGLAVKIYIDNNAARQAAMNHAVSQRSKHIDTRYHYIRQLVARGDVVLEYVASADNIADLLTKAVGGTVLERLIDKLLKTTE